MEPRQRYIQINELSGPELQKRAWEVGKKWEALIIAASEIDKELAEAARVGALRSKAAWDAVYEIKPDVDELWDKIHVERSDLINEVVGSGYYERDIIKERIRLAVEDDAR